MRYSSSNVLTIFYSFPINFVYTKFQPKAGYCVYVGNDITCSSVYRLDSSKLAIYARPVTSLVWERQLRLYEHVVRLPDVDPAHRVVSVQDNPEWRRTRGRPHSSWVRQVDRSCMPGGTWMDMAAAWELAQGDRRECRRRVSEATNLRRMLPVSS